ncbi:hypothetical protein [Clostridium perfringens]|uniref:hypothetical protein n=1 Tax=Clostridium perfringens TaxID=1502 RepID=UPI00096AA9BC|nr:hypothetical protein [Clostridium perfringens]
MREIKLWDNRKYCRTYLRRSEEYRREEFMQEYIEYIEGFNEEYYVYSGVEGYVHKHYDDEF